MHLLFELLLVILLNLCLCELIDISSEDPVLLEEFSFAVEHL
jgi:hypothetical protein